MKIQILDKAKKKKFISGVEDLGISRIRELLVRSGKERIRAYSGNLSKEEIMDLWKLLPIEGIGLYVGKETIDRSGVREVRLSLDGLHIWSDQITKNIISLDEEREIEWFFGKNIELDEKTNLKGFVAVASNDSGDFIGVGKVSEDGMKITSFLPKERRRKG